MPDEYTSSINVLFALSIKLFQLAVPALAAGIWGDRLSRGALFAFWVFAVYAGTACDLLVSIDQGLVT